MLRRSSTQRNCRTLEVGVYCSNGWRPMKCRDGWCRRPVDPQGCPQELWITPWRLPRLLAARFALLDGGRPHIVDVAGPGAVINEPRRLAVRLSARNQGEWTTRVVPKVRLRGSPVGTNWICTVPDTVGGGCTAISPSGTASAEIPNPWGRHGTDSVGVDRASLRCVCCGGVHHLALAHAW